MSQETPSPPRRYRLLASALVVLAVFGSAAGWIYLRVTERSRVLAAITQAGGQYQEEAKSARFGRMFLQLLGNQNVSGGDAVYLDGPHFDDAWLSAQQDLRSLALRELFIRESQLGRKSVMRLVRDSNLSSLIAPGIAITDADAQVIGSLEGLDNVNLMQSEITDVGLAALRPKRLIALNVAGTRVTGPALQQELTGSRVQFLLIDGRQFTPELAAQFAQSGTLRTLTLFGPQVTEEHVALVKSIPSLASVRFDQTSISAETAEALSVATLGSMTVEVAPPSEVFFKWRPEK